MPRKPRKSRTRVAKVSRIEPIPITDPAARDEGPRLIPLRSTRPDGLTGKKFLDLADRALHGPHTRKP